MAEEQTQTTQDKPTDTKENTPNKNQEWADMIEVKDNVNSGEVSSEGNKILNQEEIDSLLGYSSEDESYRGLKTGFQAILNSTMVSYERLPMLEIVLIA